jgi:hypothetical protein
VGRFAVEEAGEVLSKASLPNSANRGLRGGMEGSLAVRSG